MVLSAMLLLLSAMDDDQKAARIYELCTLYLDDVMQHADSRQLHLLPWLRSIDTSCFASALDQYIAGDGTRIITVHARAMLIILVTILAIGSVGSSLIERIRWTSAQSTGDTSAADEEQELPLHHLGDVLPVEDLEN